jgi:hypothetical protein
LSVVSRTRGSCATETSASASCTNEPRRAVTFSSASPSSSTARGSPNSSDASPSPSVTPEALTTVLSSPSSKVSAASTATPFDGRCVTGLDVRTRAVSGEPARARRGETTRSSKMSGVTSETETTPATVAVAELSSGARL